MAGKKSKQEKDSPEKAMSIVAEASIEAKKIIDKANAEAQKISTAYNQSAVPDFITNDKPQNPEVITNVQVSGTVVGGRPKVPYYMLKDITEVFNKDPLYGYRWVEQSKVRQRRAEFFEVVGKDSPEYAVAGDEQGATGKTLDHGNHILMKVPKEHAEARNEYFRKESVDREKMRLIAKKQRAAIKMLDYK